MQYAPPPVAANTGTLSGALSNYGIVFGIILVFSVVLVIYHKTVGYYFEIGWKRLYELLTGQTQVDVEVGGDADPLATLKPTPKPQDQAPGSSATPPSERTPGLPGAGPDSSLLQSVGSLFPTKGEVFNVSRNIYTYGDASAVCSAFDAELATYDQVQEAQAKGADWCNYGWIKGQMAVYPTQKATYEKLQKGAAEYRNACGQPGVNGGYFDNPELRFGVNCFGQRPAQNATDELQNNGVELPPTTEMIEYDKKVQRFREQLGTTTVLPFRRGQWTA
jgi:hypothetical protein